MAPKSNAAYVAIDEALEDVKHGRTLPVPIALRDGSHKGAKAAFGNGTGYLYPHNYEGGHIPQRYLPEGRTYYRPTANGIEAKIQARLAQLRPSDS
jgi:putative ATPase